MQRENAGYLAKEVSSLCGVPYRTVDYWARSEFLVPSVENAAGSGTRRRYSFADLVSFRVARVLREHGISLQNLRRVQERLGSYRKVNNPLASSRLIVIPGKNPDVARVEIAEDGKRLESMITAPGQTIASAAVVVMLAPVVRDLRQRVQAKDGPLDLKQVAQGGRTPLTNQAATGRAGAQM